MCWDNSCIFQYRNLQFYCGRLERSMEVNCRCLQRARNVCSREFHAVRARCITYIVCPRIFLFLRASFHFFLLRKVPIKRSLKLWWTWLWRYEDLFTIFGYVYSKSSKALCLCDCLILIHRTPGSGSRVSVTAKEKPAEEREDHACVKDPAWECRHRR